MYTAILSNNILQKTLKELTGIENSCPGTRGMWAPKGTPKEIIDFLETAFMKGLADPEYKRVYIEEMGIQPVEWNSEMTKKWIEGNKAYYQMLLEKYSK